MKCFITCIGLMFLLLGCEKMTAQQVMGTLDSTAFLIGDQTRLRLSARVSSPPDDIKFLKSAFDDLDNISFIRQSSLYNEAQGGQTVYYRDFLISFFDTGTYYIPQIPVIIERSSRQDTFLTNPIPIKVYPVRIDSTGLANIKPIILEPWSPQDLWLYGVLGLAVLGIGFFIWRNYRRRRLANGLDVIEIERSPYELAMTELNEIDGDDLIRKNLIKEHFARLSMTLRLYLERQFNFPAAESTTMEIQSELIKVGLDDRFKDDIIDYLRQIDMIKYAKANPESNSNDSVAKTRSQIKKLNQFAERQLSEEEE